MEPVHELDDEEAQYHSKSPKQEPENDDDIEFFDPAVQLFDSGNGGQEHCEMQGEDDLDGNDEDDGDDERDETEVNDEEEKNATIKSLNSERQMVENLPPTSSAQGYFENSDGKDETNIASSSKKSLGNNKALVQSSSLSS